MEPSPARGRERLYLRFAGAVEDTDEGPDAPVDCLIRDENGGIVARAAGVLRQLAELLPDGLPPWVQDPSRVVVFVPAAEALALSCRVPGRSTAQLRRAAPYAVEEFITEDIDSMHVAVGPLARNTPVRCLVTPRTRTEGWLECLSAVGIAPGWLTADAMALAVDENQVSVLFDGGTVLVRTSDHIAEVDAPNLPAMLEAIHAELAANDATPTLRQINGQLSAIDLSQSAFTPADTETATSDGTLLAYLANTFDPDHAINLLQGDYAVKRQPSGTWQRARSVAAMAGLWLAVALAALATEGFWASYQASSLSAEAEALYRQIYDVERAPANPAARMRVMLGQASAEQLGFHNLLIDFADALGEVGDRTDITSLSYSDRTGLGVDLMLNDYPVIGRVEAALTSRRLQFELLSADRQETGRVRVTFRLTEQ